MRYAHVIGIGILVLVLAAGLFIIAAEKNDEALKQATGGTNPAPPPAKPDEANPPAVQGNGHVELWLNGKKIVDKSYSSDGKETPGTAPEEKETKYSETNADIKVVTENGKQTLYINGWKLDVAPDENGMLDVSVKIDKDGKAKLFVNGKEQGLPDGEQLSKEGVRRQLRVNPDFDFGFDLAPGERPDIEKYLRGFRGFGFDRNGEDPFAEIEKLRREMFDNLRRIDPQFNPNEIPDEEEIPEPPQDSEKGGEQKLQPRGEKKPGEGWR